MGKDDDTIRDTIKVFDTHGDPIIIQQPGIANPSAVVLIEIQDRFTNSVSLWLGDREALRLLIEGLQDFEKELAPKSIHSNS